MAVTQIHPEHSPHANLQGAHGVIMQVETLGKGVAAVLVATTVAAILLAGMSLVRAGSIADQAAADRSSSAQHQSEERTRHERTEADLLSRFEDTKKETRMQEYYLLELDGKLMAGGFIPPSRGYGQWKQEHRK